MATTPRIVIGPGDELPSFTDVLVDASGAPVDIAGRSVSMRFQSRYGGTAAAMIPIENMQVDVPTRGKVLIDWSILDGGLRGGDYDFRYVTTDGAGLQESFPKDDFYLLRVGADFPAGGGAPPAPGVRLGAWETLGSLAALAALDTSLFVKGQTFAIVQDDPNPVYINTRWRWAQTSGTPGDGSGGILDSTDPTGQWFLF